MRVLILGGAGMLGHKMAQTLPASFDTWTSIRGSSRSYERYAIFDPAKTVQNIEVTNLDAVVDAMAHVRPDVVINCVGVIKQLAAAQDPVASLTLNALLPHRLQRLCQASGARLIHISTDCVFRGTKGMYTEEDLSDSTDLYGRTKYLGETAGPGALTIRTSIIGRELETASGLVEWFLANRGGRVKGYSRAAFSGFTTLALSRIIQLVITEYPGLCGTLQVSSARIDKYELLVLLRDAYGLDIEIVRDEEVRIDRSLDSTRFRDLTGFVPPSWPDMVTEMAADPTPYDVWRSRRDS